MQENLEKIQRFLNEHKPEPGHAALVIRTHKNGKFYGYILTRYEFVPGLENADTSTYAEETGSTVEEVLEKIVGYIDWQNTD